MKIHIDKDITREHAKKAMRVLTDNGVDPLEARVVLQALGYALLGEELEDVIYATADNKTAERYAEILSLFPTKPGNGDYWTDGEMILCRTEQQAEGTANLLESILEDDVAITGYYDPEEDEESGEVDKYTGWYYVTID